MLNTHHDDARPVSTDEPGRRPTRLSTRKVRSDAGKKKGPAKPRQPQPGSFNGEYWHIPLTGTHGSGRMLTLDAEDYEDAMRLSEHGKRLQVDSGGDAGNLRVRISGKPAALWARSSNPSHQITIQRFLTAETHGGKTIHHIDGDPFNNRRSNLILKVPAIDQKFPIDWETADRLRAEKLASIFGHQAPN